MLEYVIIAALVGVIIYLSNKKGKVSEQLKQREELLDVIEKAQAARDAVADPDYRQLLINELRELGERDTLLGSADSKDKKQ